ncbi:hypothetical protein Tco_0756316 [Tanacetum coccineum]
MNNKGVSSEGPSITSIPKEGQSIARRSKERIPKELLEWYGYDTVEDYLLVAKKAILKALFSSFLGDLVREHIGLKILSWKKVDKESRDKLWDEITRYFDVDLTVRKLKEADDKIKEGTLNLDDGTDAITVVFGKEKGGYARGVGSKCESLLVEI